jgi:hypothetical protein
MAQSAASIEYEAASSPVELPDDMEPVTPQHFLTYRDEQASAADGTY